MKNKRNLGYITMSIVIFSISIIYFLFMLFLNYSEKEEFIISKTISDSSFMFLFTSVLTFPGFILHYRYKMLNKKRKITFRKNYLEITTEDGIKNVLFSDVLEVENHTVAWQGRNPWSDYNYVKIILKNGDKIYYNCLTSVKNSENNLFNINRIKVSNLEDIYPWY
jgi:hypothetical protein